MGYAISVLLVVIFIGAMLASKKLPIKLQVALIILFSFGLAWLHWSIAKTQLATTGFAARNRNPNNIAETIGYALAVVGVINIGITFINVRKSAFVLGLLFIVLPVMYFLSW